MLYIDLYNNTNHFLAFSLAETLCIRDRIHRQHLIAYSFVLIKMRVCDIIDSLSLVGNVHRILPVNEPISVIILMKNLDSLTHILA